jgi:large subunit ribosomal protein L25
MASSFEAKLRTDLGNVQPPPARRAKRYLAVVYGEVKKQYLFSVDHNKIIVAQANDAFYNETTLWLSRQDVAV